MGISFNNTSASWSYRGFNRFRRRLANEIGICLDFMEGFYDERTFFEIDKGLYCIPDQPLKWDKIQDRIKPLLNHSDCDGNLPWDQCILVARRMEELISDWNNDDYDKQNAIQLIRGMEYCYKHKKDLIFE